MRRSRSPRNESTIRVLTVCVQGRKAPDIAEMSDRLRLLDRIYGGLADFASAGSIDLILFPGGYFSVSPLKAERDYAQRCERLMNEPAIDLTLRLLERYGNSRPLAVIGCDSPPWRKEGGDQLAVALGPRGIVGLARKAFLAPKDAWHARRPLVPITSDFNARQRVVDLTGGRRILLCSCYDLFGIPEERRRESQLVDNVRYMRHGGQILRHDSAEDAFREALAGWRRLVRRVSPLAAVATIHEFDRPGADVYWQRHGVAAASASLGGRLAVGAAHFRTRLPEPHKATLASRDVGEDHLTRGNRRASHVLVPGVARFLQVGELRALLRVYSG